MEPVAIIRSISTIQMEHEFSHFSRSAARSMGSQLLDAQHSNIYVKSWIVYMR